jgi:hypothetical protein
MLPRLFDKAHELGFEATEGDGFRDPRAFGELGARGPYGHPKSGHKQKLAFDINLFKVNADGSVTYCSKTEDHRPLGEWWESQGGTWGGRFEDGNHYSLEHEGIK